MLVLRPCKRPPCLYWAYLPELSGSDGRACAALRFSSRIIASYTSCRWTGTSDGALIPRRTLSPRISTMVTTISSPIIMLSSRCRDKTNISTPSMKIKDCPQAETLDLRLSISYQIILISSNPLLAEGVEIAVLLF